MRTFRNVLYVRVGKCYVRLWRSQRSRTVVWGSLRWDESWKRPAGAGATPTALTAAAGASAADTPRHANRTPTWSSDLWGHYFAWNWTIPVVLLATVVATTATYVVVKLVQECKFFLRILLPFYGNSSPQTIHFLGKRTVTSKRSW